MLRRTPSIRLSTGRATPHSGTSVRARQRGRARARRKGAGGVGATNLRSDSPIPTPYTIVATLRPARRRRTPGGARMPTSFIAPDIPPSGTGCVECLEAGGWWLHLRRCAECGHIGCCDNSPEQHATAHAHSSSHPVICSFEPGEDWFFDYRTNQFVEGPHLAPPLHHPIDQPVPGPAGRVPANWQEQLH